MTMLIKLENGIPTGYPLLDDNFRQLFPSTSFPALLTPDSVESFGYGLYDFSGQPTPAKYEKVVESTPAKNEAGIWIQAWSVVAMDETEKAAADADKANQVRAERNAKLAETDWTQLVDSPVDHAAWFEYRQALRDIPSQAGFPWTIDWPTQP